MLPEIATGSNWLSQTIGGVRLRVVHFLLSSDPVPLERPNLAQLARPGAQLPRFVVECAVARKYLDLLGPLDWDHFPERDPHRPWPGRQPAPRAPYAAAYLVKIDQGLRYMTKLREYLVEHPALVWILGFELAPSLHYPWGFDAEASLSSSRQFGRVLRTLDNAALQFLLDGTVTLIGHELPDDINFADVVAGDTKHIIAWVVENNPKVFIEDRYDKTRQPKGDPDCRLGCKKKRNQGPVEETQADGASADSQPPGGTPTTDPVPASTVKVGEYYWGYASGVIATKVPDWGEFALAELTQPFDRNDITYFFPLMGDAERRLPALGPQAQVGRRPRYGAFDMAFEAHYVFDYFHQDGGFAAIPLSNRGDNTRQFDEAGLPLCSAGLAMPVKSTFICRTTEVEHERGRYACPLLYPQPTGDTCPIDHKRWEKGGCLLTMPTSIGARIRYQLDRESQQFKDIYKQRTATERVNSQAVELGIERPKLRNGQAIINQNTLIYVLINLRALQRIRARKAELARRKEATHTSS
jgi:hypothetical protein